MAEYAQILRYRNISINNYRGSQCRITLPTQKQLYDWDYINFYCGIAGWECGISTRPFTTGGEWRIFVNGPEGLKPFDNLRFSDGDSLTLKLYIDDSSNKIVFRVNDDPIFTSRNTYSGGQGRIVLAGYQATENDISWRVKHNLTIVQNIFLKNANKVWVAFSDSIGTYDRESWGSTDPEYYDTDWDNGGNFTASLLL